MRRTPFPHRPRLKPGRSIYRYLLDTFGGYTAAAGNIYGYWKDEDGRESYGEHKEYKVGLKHPARLPELKAFLARLSAQLEEECLYVECGREALFVYASG